MMTHHKILMRGTGKQLSRYLSGTRTLLNDLGEFATGAAGWNSQGIWRQDMALQLADALGVDPTQPPSEEGSARLFAGCKADTGKKWTREKREIAAVDLQVAPHKSVTLAIILAESKTERAALLQAARQANDYAMGALTVALGVTRIGQAGLKGRIRGEAGWISYLHFAARPTPALRHGLNGQITITNSIVPCDPQIHIHNIWFNLLFCSDGRFRALDFGQLRHIKEFGGIFHARFTGLLRKLGVGVRLDDTRCATVIDAVPDTLSNLFSKGRTSIEARAQRFAHEQGFDWEDLPLPRKRAIRRQSASHRISRQDGEGNLARWRSEAAAAGFRYTTCMTDEPPLSLTRGERMEHGYWFVAHRLAAAFLTAPWIRLETVHHWAAVSLISVGIENSNDVNVVIGMLQDRGIIMDGKPRRLILPECWHTPYDNRTRGLTLEPLYSDVVYQKPPASDMKTTKSRRQNQDQSESEQWLTAFTALVDGFPALIWRAAADGYWFWASPQWSEYTGFSEKVSQNRGWLNAIHADDREMVVAAWRQAKEFGHFHVACRLRCAADGSWRWCQSHAVRQRSATSHDAEEWLGMFIDVSDLIPAAEKVREK